jgi:COP9 signalosome complex subunit 1
MDPRPLASFDRKELKEKVMDSVTFRAMMESAPAMRDLVNDFHGSKYKKLFDGMDDAKPVLELDLHLHDHVESLYAAIRKRALVQYCIPYSVVDLNRMGEAFRTRASPELERELAGLIAEREIAARIDAQAGTMEKRASASRESAFKAALGAGKEVRSIHWSPYDRVGVVNADP